MSRRSKLATALHRLRPWGLVFLLLAAPLFAQEAPQIREGWHTVRPGDTLENITAHYLGTPERWRENWDLNAAEIGDPDLIYPGQRLRMLIQDALPADGALLFRMAREVKDQLLPFEWRDAKKNDLLRPRDQVRTLDDASAQLVFYDDTTLTLTERSLVTVGESQRPEPQVERAQIEIVLGQADLAAKSSPASSAEIEIVLGDATATPRPSAAGVVETRARRPEGGGAQVMVYAGESELEAAGTQITVLQGMGSAVPEGEPPRPPEKLLDPPSGLVPAAGAELLTPRPEFRWNPVPGASSYTVEVCGDERCGELVERAALGGDAASWQPGERKLPLAALYWRVTATSASGLDGYPSAAVPFAIVAELEDQEPPQVAVRFVGPQDPPRSGFNDKLIVGPGIEIEVEAEDASGIRESNTVVDGQQAAPAALPGPRSEGDHTAAAWAVDGAGNRAESESVPFVYDPDPPRFRWGIEGDGVFREVDPAYYAAPAFPAPAKRGRRYLQEGKREWFVDSDFTQIILRPVGWKTRVGGVDKALKLKKGLWILAEDEICPRVETLSYDIVERPEPLPAVLVVEATDCVGNRSRIEWPLAPSR